jgi:PIN domain nuclease of toxin-antitoxin system
MKKITLLLFVLTLAAGFALAQEEEDGGIGLTAGLEFGISGINIEEDQTPYLTPGIAFENSFGNFDVYAGVDYTFNFTDGVPQSLYAEEEAAYNLSLGDIHTLTFTLHNENDIYTAADPFKFGDANGDGSIFEPSVTYTLGLNPGDLYVTAGLPLTYQPETALGAYGTVGFGFSFGLGLEATLNFGVNPEAEYSGVDFLVSYEHDLFYAEVEINTDKEFTAFTVTPEFDYFFNNFTFFIKAEFADIGGEEIGITPAIGVTYSF